MNNQGEYSEVMTDIWKRTGYLEGNQEGKQEGRLEGSFETKLEIARQAVRAADCRACAKRYRLEP